MGGWEYLFQFADKFVQLYLESLVLNLENLPRMAEDCRQFPIS